MIGLAIYLWSNQLWLWAGPQNKYGARDPLLVRNGRGLEAREEGKKGRSERERCGSQRTEAPKLGDSGLIP